METSVVQNPPKAAATKPRAIFHWLCGECGELNASPVEAYLDDCIYCGAAHSMFVVDPDIGDAG